MILSSSDPWNASFGIREFQVEVDSDGELGDEYRENNYRAMSFLVAGWDSAAGIGQVTPVVLRLMGIRRR